MKTLLNSYKKKTNRYWLFKTIANPKIYLFKLLINTCIVSLFTLILIFAAKYFNFYDVTIPSSIHSLLGFVISMLLIFRTNTAYDRWWEGRKAIQKIQHNLMLLYSQTLPVKTKTLLMNEINIVIDKLHSLLTADRVRKINLTDNIKYIYENASHCAKNDVSKYLDNFFEAIQDCIRIKNTPIPIAYMLHIKLTIRLYILTLPFGLFHDMGYYAIPIIALIYYIIAGIELVSEEIEDPFLGEPNDLDVTMYFNEIKNIISK